MNRTHMWCWNILEYAVVLLVYVSGVLTYVSRVQVWHSETNRSLTAFVVTRVLEYVMSLTLTLLFFLYL